MKLVEGKELWKRVVRLLRLRNEKQQAIRCNLLEAIARVQAGAIFADGKVRMKVVLRKNELKHMLLGKLDAKNTSKEAISSSSSSSSFPLLSSILSFEQRLQYLQKRQLGRADSMKGRRGSWRPALQSIPEEL